MNQEYILKNQHLLLLPEKVVFWKEKKTLIVSDMHLGKANHFRKSGIALPDTMGLEDLGLLADLVFKYEAENILFLGDLFHSDYNHEFNWFADWLDGIPVNIRLVLGNHDIHSITQFKHPKLVISDFYESGPFLFTHEPLKSPGKDIYNIAGHLHAGFRLHGKGRQTLKLPCFYFGKNKAIMPAFGNLTGAMSLKQNKADVFVIVDNKVFKV